MVGLLLVLAFTATIPAGAQVNSCDFSGMQDSGAEFCIEMPPEGQWNGALVIFAHGYVSVDEPIGIPWDQLYIRDNDEFIYVPDLINQMGFAFATTSYSVNGLAVKEGIADVVDLVSVFGGYVEPPFPLAVYLVGASEGGLITTLALERHPEIFTGGLAMCGPIGSFTGQINYWGDFRVVFDYFMDTPELNVLPGNAASIPAVLMKQWDTEFVPRVGGVLQADMLKTQQLFSVTSAPFDLLNPMTMGESTLGILWYNVFATEDAIDKLGGRPFDNFDRAYEGSFDDDLLNARVKRFKAQPAALEEIANNYETTGKLTRPLVTMHTTGDPIVPAWHQQLYWDKVHAQNLGYLGTSLMIEGYGHCAFSPDDVLTAFSLLVSIP